MIRRYWFLAAIPVVLALGIFYPRGGAYIRSTQGMIPLLVATVLFISGLTLNLGQVVRHATNYRAIGLTLASTYLIAPSLGYGLARLWGPPLNGVDSQGFLFLQAFMITAAQAGTLAASIALTRIAGGDNELAVVLTLVSNFLTAVLTPIILKLSIGTRVSLPIAEMMMRIALVVLLPVLLGIVTRRMLGKHGKTVLPMIRPLPQIIILTFFYTGFSASAKHLVREFSLALRFAGACASMHLLMLLYSYWAAKALRFEKKELTTLVFCGSQKTVTNGIYLWERFFSANPYGAVPLVIHQIFQLLVGMVLASWFRRGSPSADERGQDSFAGKGTEFVCAQHPSGRSGKRTPSP